MLRVSREGESVEGESAVPLEGEKIGDSASDTSNESSRFATREKRFGVDPVRKVFASASVGCGRCCGLSASRAPINAAAQGGIGSPGPSAITAPKRGTSWR